MAWKIQHTAAKHARQFPGILSRGLDALWPSTISLELDKNDWAPDDEGAYCPRCGASAGPGSLTGDRCTFCQKQRVPWDRLTRLSVYDEPLDAWIKAMKFGRQWSWAPWFGRQLATIIDAKGAGEKVIVVAVPMWWSRRWFRGFNQAHLMAHALAKHSQLACPPLLKRTHATPPQTSVVASARDANVRKSFAIAPVDLSDTAVILVDDVKTTGATAGACAKLLRQAGATHIHLAVAAVADPKGKDFKAK